VDPPYLYASFGSVFLATSPVVTCPTCRRQFVTGRLFVLPPGSLCHATRPVLVPFSCCTEWSCAPWGCRCFPAFWRPRFYGSRVCSPAHVPITRLQTFPSVNNFFFIPRCFPPAPRLTSYASFFLTQCTPSGPDAILGPHVVVFPFLLPTRVPHAFFLRTIPPFDFPLRPCFRCMYVFYMPAVTMPTISVTPRFLFFFFTYFPRPVCSSCFRLFETPRSVVPTMPSATAFCYTQPFIE